ncbi:MAG: hypothetical protein IJ220_04910 [Clostridia bacterium]|nr:hypothetical protein [Clostridia bacterium]
MLEFVICVVVITFGVFFFLNHRITKKEQNYYFPFERLKKSERQLQEFLAMSPEERLEHFDLFRKAIDRLYTTISEIEGINYPKKEFLNWDHLHADIRILQFYNEKGELSFISHREVSSTYQKISKEDFDSIDEQLVTTCNRWLNEVSAIEAAILEAKKAES